jgi:hypothetical protein
MWGGIASRVLVNGKRTVQFRKLLGPSDGRTSAGQLRLVAHFVDFFCPA